MREEYLIYPEILAEAGWTSSQLVRAAHEIIWRTDAREAVILVGTNDAKDELCVPSDVYMANVLLLHEWLRGRGVRPYVCTIPAPGGFGSPGYTNRVLPRVKEYNESLRRVVEPRLIECECVGPTVDGVHLTEVGARDLARRVWTAIKSERTLI